MRSADDTSTPTRRADAHGAPSRRRRSAHGTGAARTVDLRAPAVVEVLPQPAMHRDGLPWLRGVLFGLDALAVALGWLLTVITPMLVDGSVDELTVSMLVDWAIVVVICLGVIASQGLYRARVCGVRAVEIARLGRASVMTGVIGVVVADRVSGFGVPLRYAIACATITFLLLTLFRGFYGAWLRRGRTQGRFCRPIVVVGTGPEGFELYRLLEHHPELGFRVLGVVGNRNEAREWNEPVAWLGDLDDTATIVRDQGANGVIIAVSDLPTDQLNRITRELMRADVHVHVSSGLRGIDHRRLRALPLAHEPLFYLEPASLARWQVWVKRVLDVTLASVTLVLISPILLVSALAVKLQDRGPVFFRQTRVGRHGKEFTLLKLRTMVPDAESRLVDLTFTNQRKGGPLFKLEQDPRRTRVGSILERTSIDELPQLINVLRGEMSLVGPRPALPHEVAQFDDELLGRQSVPPGITGLWQVEGRENPAFDVYRRLDLFYVENWSVGLDLAILFATAQAVCVRILRWSRLVGRSAPPLAAVEERGAREEAVGT